MHQFPSYSVLYPRFPQFYDDFSSNYVDFDKIYEKFMSTGMNECCWWMNNLKVSELYCSNLGAVIASLWRVVIRDEANGSMASWAELQAVCENFAHHGSSDCHEASSLALLLCLLLSFFSSPFYCGILREEGNSEGRIMRNNWEMRNDGKIIPKHNVGIIIGAQPSIEVTHLLPLWYSF